MTLCIEPLLPLVRERNKVNIRRIQKLAVDLNFDVTLNLCEVGKVGSYRSACRA